MAYFFLSEKCTDGVDSLRIKNCLGNTPTKLCKDIYLQDLLIAAKPTEVKAKINRDFRDQKKTGAKKDGYRNKAAEWVGVAARDNDLVSMQQHMGDFGPKQQQVINTADFLGMYPLHYAVACASVSVVKCLLDCKADLTVKSRTGNTPLHYAYSNGKKVGAHCNAPLNPLAASLCLAVCGSMRLCLLPAARVCDCVWRLCCACTCPCPHPCTCRL